MLVKHCLHCQARVLKSHNPTGAMDSAAQKLSKKEQAFADAKGRGNAAVSAGDWVAAIECYTEALKAAPSTYLEPEGPAAAVLSNRSLAHLKCGFFEKALQDANDCIKIRPDWAKSHFRRYAFSPLFLLRPLYRRSCDPESIHSQTAKQG